jgi:Flp pilus assembly protein TadD
MAEMGRRGAARAVAPFVLICAGLGVYHGSFSGAFLLDDFYRITENQQIRRLWPPWDVVARSSRPVVDLSLAVNYALGGLTLWGYHAFNLAVHLLAGLTLFGVVRRTLESRMLRDRYGRAGSWLALAIALIWLVHPLQTESVTYVIQRGESLMGLFYLLTLYCGIRGFESPHARLWFTASVGACALGMGSKEVMVTAPIMVLLYDRIFISASCGEIARRRWRFYLGLASTWGLLAALVATSRPEDSAGLTGTLTPWSYAAAQLGIVVHYLRLSVWPHPLVFDYTWRLPESPFAVLPWAVMLGSLVGATLLALWRLPWAGFWGVWIFLILAPTSSIFPIADLAFEHRMYLSLAGVVALVVMGAHEAVGFLLRRLETPDALRRWLEVGLAVAVVAMLGAATIRRNQDYRSDLAMWTDTVARRPDNPRAHNNLGIALDRLGRTGEAIPHFAEAVRLKANYVEARVNLADALARQGRNKEAIAQYSQALRFTPDSASARHNLGVVLYREGLIDRAIAEYSEALRLRPAFPEAHHNLGLALAKQGRIDEAIAHLREAVRLRPDYARAHNNLGSLLYQRGQVKEAIAQFAEAVRLDPGSSDAVKNLRAARASLEQAKP